MGSLVTSCRVMEKAGSCCGWVPAPLMTVRASKKGICRGSSESSANKQAGAWGIEREQGDNGSAGIGVCGCKWGPRGTWSPAARAEGLAGLGAIQTCCALWWQRGSGAGVFPPVICCHQPWVHDKYLESSWKPSRWRAMLSEVSESFQPRLIRRLQLCGCLWIAVLRSLKPSKVQDICSHLPNVLSFLKGLSSKYLSV